MDIATSFYLSALLIFILLKTGIGFKDENLLSTTYSKISEQWIIKMKATQNSTKEHSSFKKLLLLYDYIEADNLTVIHNYGPLKVRKLRFVHIPKTGIYFLFINLISLCTIFKSYFDIRILIILSFYRYYICSYSSSLLLWPCIRQSIYQCLVAFFFYYTRGFLS